MKGLKCGFILVFLSVSVFSSCTSEEVWDPESKAQAYFTALYLVNREVVYNLDYLFEASALLDAVQNDGDDDKIMSRYFSREDRTEVSYSLPDNTIKIIVGHKTLDIQTGGHLLTVSGATWTVDGSIQRIWESKTQPEQEPFSFTVTNTGNGYTLMGLQVSNYLREFYFTYSDLDLVFTTSPTVIHDQVSGDGQPDDRPMNIYTFNGSISTRTPDSGDEVYDIPKLRVSTLRDVKGGNPYEYYQGEPIFIGQFFLSGKVIATFGHTGQADSFEADYSKWQATLNGTTYSF